MSLAPLPAPEPDYSNTSTGLTDADIRRVMLQAIRLAVMLAAIVAAIFLWRAGWQAAVLVMVGAAISTASLWEWLRLMTAFNQRMDAGKGTPRPTGSILFGFFTRLALTLVALYASLKYLHGTAFALAAGLGVGVVSLSFEAFRLLKRGPQL